LWLQRFEVRSQRCPFSPTPCFAGWSYCQLIFIALYFSGFFEALHLELEDKYGVSVTIVTPGFVKTNINERRLGEKGVNEIASGMPADVLFHSAPTLAMV